MATICLQSLEEQLDIWRFSAETRPASVLPEQGFFSLTRTADELSLVCLSTFQPAVEGKVEHDWLGFKVAGPLDFGLTGILNKLTTPLADAAISIFALSTYDTDYLFVKKKDFVRAKQVLSQHFEVR